MTRGYVHGYASEEQQRLVEQAEHWRDELILAGTELAPGTRLLEVGCGVGAVLKVLGQAFPGVRLAGVDVEERQVAAARAYLAEHGLEADLRRAHALELPYEEGSFDHVWMMWFLEHVADPVGALREAGRVLAPGGRLTAIEVDYTTVWTAPPSDDFRALFAAVARAMETGGRSDAGTRLPGWLAAAGFAAVDPGERRLEYTGAGLARQAPYVAAVVESTLADLARLPGVSVERLEAGLAHLRSLPATPGAALGWVVHKSQAAASYRIDGRYAPRGLVVEPAARRSVRTMVVVADSPGSVASAEVERRLEQHRGELTAYCYRMLASPFEAEDAVQETLLRAWRSIDRFEGRSQLRSWLYRIATNVCFDLLSSRERRARPMDLGPAREPVESNLNALPEVTWIEPIPDRLVAGDGDPAEVAVARESIRLAFVAALQHLPPRQRAALILCEVLRWKASEAAELLETTVASINSALQRARATLDATDVGAASGELDEGDRELLARYVQAFEAYDMEALTRLIHEDATQSMPPFDLWLRGRDDIFTWWWGPGIGCRGSRVIPTVAANGSPAFGQYKPSASGGYEPWALQVVELEDGKIVELTFFLDTKSLFPLFGLPDRLDG